MDYLTVLRSSYLLSEPAQLAHQAIEKLENPKVASPHSLSRSIRLLGDHCNSLPDGTKPCMRIGRYGTALTAVCGPTLGHTPDLSESLSAVYLCSQYGCAEGHYVSAIDGHTTPAFPYSSSQLNCSDHAPALSLPLTAKRTSLLGGPTAALEAVVCAMRDISEDQSSRVLLASSDVLGGATLEYNSKNLPPKGAPLPCSAEGAAALWLGAPTDSLPGPRVRLRHHQGSAGLALECFEGIFGSWLREKEQEVGKIDRIISVSSDPKIMSQEGQEVRALLPNAHLSHLAWKLGDCGASLGLLGLISALEESGVTLVMATDDSASLAILVSTL